MATKRKKKKRRSGGGSGGARKGGVMMGMRSGFKNVARTVGVGDEPAKAPSKSKSLLGTALTVVLVAVAAYVLYTRFG